MSPSRTVFATLALVALLVSPAVAAPSPEDLARPPASLEPSTAVTLPTGVAPLFRIHTFAEDRYLWLYVSRSPVRDATGMIDKDVEIEPFAQSASDPAVWEAKPAFFDYSAFWMNTPGTYYWQPYRISYGSQPDGTVEGEVRTFTLSGAPSTPPPASVVQPTGSCGTAPGQRVCVDAPPDIEKYGCLRQGAFVHRFGIKLKKLSGGLLVNRRARVQIVYFSLDGRRSGSDRTRPYYALVAGRVLTAGRHMLRADVRMKVPATGKKVRKQLRFSFKTCAPGIGG